ncbi:zinc finger C2HC domain-containing protein 1C isoform X5 [Prinia subflava]|uniref:zinc finger C2HC domain-containing protein 1C isoform X5 n=1 Tax=Prinia subflava TaxID=208062 RepID=UPI002FDFBE84
MTQDRPWPPRSSRGGTAARPGAIQGRAPAGAAPVSRQQPPTSGGRSSEQRQEGSGLSAISAACGDAACRGGRPAERRAQPRRHRMAFFPPVTPVVAATKFSPGSQLKHQSNNISHEFILDKEESLKDLYAQKNQRYSYSMSAESTQDSPRRGGLESKYLISQACTLSAKSLGRHQGVDRAYPLQPVSHQKRTNMLMTTNPQRCYTCRLPVLWSRRSLDSAASANSKTPPRRNNWKAKHEALIRIMSQARQAQQTLTKGRKVSDLPPLPPIENPDYVACTYCGRKFAPQVAERHIPKCKNIKNRPPPPPQRRR